MYNVSNDYKLQLKKKNQEKRLTGTIAGVEFNDADILTGTFNISNQCSDVNEVKIGSIYIGQLSMTLKPQIMFESWENLKIIVNEELWIDEARRWESVPLGVFYIASAEDTDYGTDIVAYDVMSFFDKKCDVDITTGYPYDLLVMACNKCGVVFGMTRAEVESIVNGTETFVLYPDNDIEIWQDYVYWLAQSCCSIATSDRSGRLVLRQYNQNVVDSFNNHERFSDSRFSKFITRYSGLSVVNMESQKTEYIGSDNDIYLTYNLGTNPFLQYGSNEIKSRVRRNILNALGMIEYVPFETQVLAGAIYDLGDVIRFNDGIASGNMSCIMYYNYTFSQGYSIAGYGSNPALASAKSKTDKNLQGLANQTKSNDIQFYLYENAQDIEIGNEQSKDIINIRFASTTAVQVLFQAEILLEADTNVSGIDYNDVVVEVIYIINGSEIQYFHPKEIYVDGKHILNLSNVFHIENNTINNLIVRLNINGGVITIPSQNIRAAIYGQGLVGSEEWDGFLDFEENLVSLTMPADITIATYESRITTNIYTPSISNFTESIPHIVLSSPYISLYEEDMTTALEEE